MIDTWQDDDDEFDVYLSQLKEAEKERKARNVEAAERLYEKCLDNVESSEHAERLGLPPAPYREYAKMLYHVGRKSDALDVLDRHIGYEESRDRKPDPRISLLSNRLAVEDFQQMPGLYE